MSISDSWTDLNTEVEKLCEELDRPLPKIIAVTKTRSIDEIQEAWDVGIRAFGENYAHELRQKAEIIPNAEWHYIGHLQRGNVNKVTPFASYIHSVDTLKLARKIKNSGYKKEVLVQINISNESAKHGIALDYDSISQFVKTLNAENIHPVGFMAMGEFTWNDKEIDFHFAKIPPLLSNFNFPQLSLGMSNDFKIALKYGSTMIRIGTRIFGPRN